jgi:hypothetical protein
MTTTLAPDLSTSPDVTVGSARANARNLWALWGLAAAAFGGVATLLPSKVNSQPDKAHRTASVINTLHRWPYQVSVITGFAAVACLLVAAAGWRRWAAERAPDSLSASVIARALGASAAAMMIAYGFQGALAVYLHGGINEKMFSAQGLFSLYMFVDFGPYIAWWGVAAAAVALAYAAFREGLVPRSIGVFSIVFLVVAVAPLVATGLPGMAGVVGPIWLAATSIAVARTRRLV